MAVILVTMSCRAAPGPDLYPEVQPVVLLAPSSDVWAAAVEATVRTGFRYEVLSRESGYLETSDLYSPYTRGDSLKFDCGTDARVFSQIDHTFLVLSLRIAIIPVGNQTRVVVQTRPRFTISQTAPLSRCTSRGTFETEFIDRLRTLAQEYERQRRTP
jgi:hypothetical protein